jgi:SAM-dependent methyltransferase
MSDLRRRLRRARRPIWLGSLRRTRPVSDVWGRDRGAAIDRYYIERFLAANASLIRGRVLEVADDRYTRRFGSGVERSDVLDVDAGNPHATLVADLTAADALPTEAFDCFVLTQTLQYVYDLPTALAHVQRVLRPGGALLLTVPSVSRISPGLADTEYWRFTVASCRRLLHEAFPGGEVRVAGRGNVLTCIAFLTGLAQEDLRREELDVDDENFPLVVTARAVKRGTDRA